MIEQKSKITPKVQIPSGALPDFSTVKTGTPFNLRFASGSNFTELRAGVANA